jgi:cofilin
MSSASGVKTDPEIPTRYDSLKLRSEKAFMCCMIKDKTLITFDDQIEAPASTQSGEENEAVFNDLKAKLVDKEPRYIVFDFRFPSAEGKKIEKLAFVFWCSDCAPVSQKMIYASSKDSFKKALHGLSIEFQANEKADLDYNTMKIEVEKRA